MIGIKKIIWLSFIWLMLPLSPLLAQPYLYFVGNDGGGYGLGYINLATCEYCINFNIPTSIGAIQDVIPMPNGQVVTLTSGNFNVFNPPNSTPVSTFATGLITGSGAILSPNGTIYYFALSFPFGGLPESCLYEYNPATNTNTNLGCANDVILFDLFFWNGTLYAFGSNGQQPPNEVWGLYSIAIGSPLVVTLEETYPFTLCGGATAAIPGVGIYTSVLDPNCDGSILYNFDLPGNTTSFECDLNPAGFPYGLSEIPASFPPPPTSCGCETESGEVNASNNSLCPTENFNFTNTGSNLDPDDALEYILFTDLADTLGSILLTSGSPSFSFSDPPLQTGVTYYVAAIAGNELPGGGVDVTDICLDISNAVEVLWNPLPTVEFAIANPDVCQGGCTNVEVALTGSPPFSLTYDTPGNAGQTASFPGLTGTLEICVPSGAVPGSFNLQAVSLTDANCSCE